MSIDCHQLFLPDESPLVHVVIDAIWAVFEWGEGEYDNFDGGPALLFFSKYFSGNT